MTDISNVTGVSTDRSRLSSKQNLEKAGQRFEAVFNGMMIAEARKAHLADPLFGSAAIDTFREMQDKNLAQSMAEHAPMGIGKAMTDFLSRSQPDLNGSGPNPDA